MGEATGGRGGGGGGTEDSWSQLGSVLSARVGHRAAAVRAGEGRGTHSGGGGRLLAGPVLWGGVAGWAWAAGRGSGAEGSPSLDPHHPWLQELQETLKKK